LIFSDIIPSVFKTLQAHRN